MCQTPHTSDPPGKSAFATITASECRTVLGFHKWYEGMKKTNLPTGPNIEGEQGRQQPPNGLGRMKREINESTSLPEGEPQHCGEDKCRQRPPNGLRRRKKNKLDHVPTHPNIEGEQRRQQPPNGLGRRIKK
jgi:hypothetical protein